MQENASLLGKLLTACEHIKLEFMLSSCPTNILLGLIKLSMERKIIDFLIRRRLWLALVSLLATAIASYGAKNLYLESDYKIYFESDDPHLIAHEDMRDEYTTTDNFAILLRPADGNLFTARVLSIIYEISELGWQAPYAVRVDSITNFQHTAAEGDSLVVEDLVLDPTALSDDKIRYVKEIALNEPQLINRLVSQDGETALISVSLELPLEADPNASLEEQAAQRALRDGSHPQVIAFGNQIRDEYQAKYPDLEIHLVGLSAINNAFSSMATQDLKFLVPTMYGAILILLLVFFRSFGSVFATLLVIACASLCAVGWAGWAGIALNTVNSMTPTIVLAIAVCDAVHLLSVYLRNLGQDMSPEEAMRESMRLNLQPVVLTSVTTIVGFLTLNFSISPPFVELGNMTAVGVFWAMMLTFTLLPAIAMLLTKTARPRARSDRWVAGYSHWIVANRHAALLGTLLVAVIMIMLIPKNKIDDDPIGYFQPGVPYRDAMDFSILHLPAVKDINFELSCDGSSCVSEPAFLNTLDQFSRYLEGLPGVVYVGSYINVVKRLNRSMNGDDERFYSVPEQADLAAQYNLMYEMSLPYGLDLNNQLNLDKSSTKVHVLTTNITNLELIEVAEQGQRWLEANYQEKVKPGASVSIMFAHVGENNIRSMLWGSLFAIIGVTITILIALRSFRYALISMTPNAVPALMAIGLWGLLVGQVNMAVAAVFSISLGILVDDTVHFISKYRRARRVKGLSKEESIHYAFANVGSALVVTTIVLSIGFMVLASSDFNLNAMSGALTAITIVTALVFDFLILPPILMLFDRDIRLESPELTSD